MGRNKMNRPTTTPREMWEGYNAALGFLIDQPNGKKLNPYPQTSDEFTFWEEGWEDSIKEFKEDVQKYPWRYKTRP
jgi:hypothetical protein